MAYMQWDDIMTKFRMKKLININIYQTPIYVYAKMQRTLRSHTRTHGEYNMNINWFCFTSDINNNKTYDLVHHKTHGKEKKMLNFFSIKK